MPYQILALPFIREKGKCYYALFKRKDMNAWQGIAGGGEEGEKPTEAAKREIYEEIGISPKSKMVQLSSTACVPVVNISGFIWGENVLVIPEFSFGVELKSRIIKISHEHSTYKWFTYDEAMKKLKWDSNKTALWELNHRIQNKKLSNIRKPYGC